MSVFVCKGHFWWRQPWRHLHLTMLQCWDKFSNILVQWSIRMIRTKNYKTVSKFVKVMTKILWPLFFPDTVYIASTVLYVLGSMPYPDYSTDGHFADKAGDVPTLTGWLMGRITYSSAPGDLRAVVVWYGRLNQATRPPKPPRVCLSQHGAPIHASP